MRKLLLFAVAIAATGAILAGCGKSEDPATPLSIDTSQTTATIVLYLYYQPSQMLPTPPAISTYVAVPEEYVNPTITFNNNIFGNGATGVTDISSNYTYVSEGADAGKLTINVPAPSTGISMEVTVSLAPFFGIQTRSDGTTANGYYDSPLPLFPLPSIVTAGQTSINSSAMIYNFLEIFVP